MWGTLCEPTRSWVYRLFAYTPETSSLRVGRLHFNPVPGSIPRERWIRTHLRLQHFGAADPAGIAARLQKYAEADPRSEYCVDQAGRMPSPDRPRRGIGPRRSATHPFSSRLGRASLDDPSLFVLLPARNSADDLPGYPHPSRSSRTVSSPWMTGARMTRTTFSPARRSCGTSFAIRSARPTPGGTTVPTETASSRQPRPLGHIGSSPLTPTSVWTCPMRRPSGAPGARCAPGMCVRIPRLPDARRRGAL